MLTARLSDPGQRVLLRRGRCRVRAGADWPAPLLLYKINASTSARMRARLVLNGTTEIKGRRIFRGSRPGSDGALAAVTGAAERGGHRELQRYFRAPEACVRSSRFSSKLDWCGDLLLQTGQFNGIGTLQNRFRQPGRGSVLGGVSPGQKSDDEVQRVEADALGRGDDLRS